MDHGGMYFPEFDYLWTAGLYVNVGYFAIGLVQSYMLLRTGTKNFRPLSQIDVDWPLNVWLFFYFHIEMLGPHLFSESCNWYTGTI